MSLIPTPFSIPPLGHIEARETERHNVTLPAQIRTATGEKIPAEMTDVSEAGCQIRYASGLAEDSHLVLAIPGFTSFGATVVWAEDDVMGLRFDKRLHPAILERLLALSFS